MRQGGRDVIKVSVTRTSVNSKGKSLPKKGKKRQKERGSMYTLASYVCAGRTSSWLRINSWGRNMSEDVFKSHGLKFKALTLYLSIHLQTADSSAHWRWGAVRKQNQLDTHKDRDKNLNKEYGKEETDKKYTMLQCKSSKRVTHKSVTKIKRTLKIITPLKQKFRQNIIVLRGKIRKAK